MSSKPKPKGDAREALVQRIVDEFAMSPQMATRRVADVIDQKVKVATTRKRDDKG